MKFDICPVWIGYLLANPLRKLIQDPAKILSPYLKPGMMALDIGPGMGFFSLPMADMVGAQGKVICVDLQEGMLRHLEKRAQKAGVASRIETRACRENSLCLSDVNGKIDFALAFAMVHEVPDAARLLNELAAALKSGGRLLISEPSGHVSAQHFEQTIALAKQHGLSVVETSTIRGGRSVLLAKS